MFSSELFLMKTAHRYKLFSSEFRTDDDDDDDDDDEQRRVDTTLQLHFNNLGRTTPPLLTYNDIITISREQHHHGANLELHFTNVSPSKNNFELHLDNISPSKNNLELY